MPKKKVDENTVTTEFCEEKTKEFVVLKKGASFATGEYVFEKNVPVPVDCEITEKLMKTGFFKRNQQ